MKKGQTDDELLVGIGELGKVAFLRVGSIAVLRSESIDGSHKVVENRRGCDARVSGFGSDGGEAVFEGGDEFWPRWTRVPCVDDARWLGEIDFGGVDEGGHGRDEISGGRCVGQRRRVALPGRLEHFAARIDEFDPVVLTAMGIAE